MRDNVQRWGNSLAIRILEAFARNVVVEARPLADGKLAASLLEVAPITLEMLLADVTEENRHREVGTGPAVGNEAW